MSRIFRKLNPLCEMCEKKGLLEPSRHVDHVRGWKTRSEFFDVNNLQALCVSCHSRKTNTTDYLREKAEEKCRIKEFRI